MTESPISLRDETGIERFRGTQSPAGGGGSQPGAARWIGPYPFTYQDFPAFAPLVLDDAVPGDLLLGVVLLVDTGFNDTDPTVSVALQVGDPSNLSVQASGNLVLQSASSVDAEGNASSVIADAVGYSPNDPVLVGSGTPNRYCLGFFGNNDGSAGAGRVWINVATPVAP